MAATSARGGLLGAARGAVDGARDDAPTIALDADYARTYPVDMNLTLSIDEALAERARAVAAGRGKSLNQLVRDLLEAETGLHDGAARAQLLDELWATSTGHSGGVRIRREDAYEGRVK